MSTQPVTLDMSTFKPLGHTEQAQTPAQSDPTSQQGSSPVTLDMSTFKPLGEPQQQTQPTGSTADRVAQGFGAGAAQGLVTAGKIGSKIPGVPWVAEKVGDVIGLPKTSVDPYKTVEQGIKPAQEAATQSLAGKIGYGLEGLAEFVSGDEALKGLGYGERLLKTGRIAKLIEEIPSLKRVFEIGMNAMRTGTVGATQGLAHGESAEEALKSGAIAGGTGAALEGVAEGVKAIAPTVKKVAGELIPVRASQESILANAAENVAPTKSLQRFDVNQTQPAARRAVGNVASDIGSKEISGQSLAREAKDLAERAEQIKAQSKPVFEKLDELTKDQEMTFSDWQKQESAAYRRGDIEATKKAKDAQAKILESFKDQFDAKDLENARSNWRQASALQDIHDSLNTKSIVGPTPIELRPKGTPDPGYINGKAFSKQILNLSNDGTLTSAGLTPQHVQALQDLGTLLEKSANVHKFGQLAKLTELGGAGLTAVLHPAAAVAGAKVAVPAYLAQRALGRVMTNSDTAETFVNLLRGVGVVAPATAAQGVSAVQK